MSGDIWASGAKNAVLPILAASVITGGENLFTACPRISDVDSMVKILKALGCVIRREEEVLAIDTSGLSEFRIPNHLMKEMRSSVFLAGSLLARCGEAVISNPGGCNIGKRPIDIHISGLEQMGALVDRRSDHMVIKARALKGTRIRLAYPSVGATENLLLAALAAEGTTVLENSAREPEIVDLQSYINRCGGRVQGAGTGVIRIEGKRKLSGCRHRIMPDRIEAGTYLLMALATGGSICLQNVGEELLKPLVELLRRGGYALRCDGGKIRAAARGGEALQEKLTTAPYPGFPTDLQPQLTAFLTRVGAGSVIQEQIFENRMEYAKQLIKMGADIEISEKQVIIRNNNILCGARVEAQDLRGGAALVIAGLMADGETIVENTRYIKRGYGNFAEKIRSLGGEIREDE